MQLNQECVRYMLIFIEENQHFGSDGVPNTLKMHHHFEKILAETDYTAADINLAVHYLHERHLINCLNVKSKTSHLQIAGITADGYDFLGLIREEKQWNTLKKTFQKVFETSALVLIQALVKKLIPFG